MFSSLYALLEGRERESEREEGWEDGREEEERQEEKEQEEGQEKKKRLKKRETGRRDRIRETMVYPIETREKEGSAWTPPSYREDQVMWEPLWSERRAG